MALLKSFVSRTQSAAAARRQETFYYVASGLWLLGAFALTLLLLNRVEFGRLGVLTFPAFGILVAAAGATLFSTLADLYGQHARDIAARAVFETLRQGGKPRPYSLYLRPFASTDMIGKNVGVGLQSERIELEAQIERATRPIGRLVALGAPLEHIGAGRIQVADDGWREAIALLLKHASLIVMLPSSRIGTLQEIAMILGSDLITRTVMIDPPNLDTPKRAYDHTVEWAKVQAAFTKAKFALPDEGRGGALIYFGDQRAPLLKEQLDIDAEDRIERLFRRIVRFRKQAGV
jgi:hypothetical protein